MIWEKKKHTHQKTARLVYPHELLADFFIFYFIYFFILRLQPRDKRESHLFEKLQILIYFLPESLA